ncbi:MAG: DUF853 family protein [Desulfobacteraceae bacterium]|nr:MAG: DUF853 family protein [Desulfobacteraceae bacterium]
MIPIGKSDIPLSILPQMANRHGLIAGATGTGKTTTLRVLAEGFSNLGVPVFMADIKGDLSGLAQKGELAPKLTERINQLGLTQFTPDAFPVFFWDVFGQQGHPARSTISEMGPLLLSRVLNLNETQSGVLNLVFKIADDSGLLLLDLEDLRAMVKHIGDNASEFKTEYGNMSTASIGSIQRNLLLLEEQGGEIFFGEPALNLEDFMQTGADGKGVINILAADKLMQTPQLYAVFLLWLLSEWFENLPEVGDLEKPKMVFFFDEAHLLFNDAPKILTDKIEQLVRLIRSKGVGIYFVTQNPLDLPETVLGQLGNRVQHALRAFTPKDQKAVKTAAQTFRPNPKFQVESAITELGVGEALVSVLDEKGVPTPVERVWIYPPQSRFQQLSPAERDESIKKSILYGHYEKEINRESAYEILNKRAAERQVPQRTAPPSIPAPTHNRPVPPPYETPAPERYYSYGGTRRTSYSRQPQSMPEKIVGSMARSAASSIGSQIGRQLIRGILGTILGGR